MEATHFYALIPMLILLIVSLVHYGKGLVHILTFSYTLCLAIFAVTNSWEIMFFAAIVGVGLISIILFCYAMANGGWL